MNAQRLIELGNIAKHEPVYSDPRFPPSLYYRFLKLLAQDMMPRLSVELGVCGGGGSLHLALGWPHGKVYGIDIFNDYPDNIEHISKVCDNFVFWVMDSVGAVDYIERANPGLDIDILFIDTIHTYERTMAEFNTYARLLSDDAVVILDDLFRDGMEQAFNDLPGVKVRMDHLHIGGGPKDGGFGCSIM